MKVGNYETRQNSKHVSYITYFNAMHGSEVIICMNIQGFPKKLQFPD